MLKTVTTALLMFTSMHVSADYPDCASEAAAEYSVPDKVFHALVLEAQANWEGKRNHHGPMGLYDLIIPIAADGVDAPESAVRSDPCVNYQAAAWWLMNQAGGNERDIWDAVATYYHGHKERDSYPMRDRVRAIYEQL
ncbi:MAG: putative conjugal transfer protein [Marinobacter sp. T13-3]|nr:MAG: putative conjugal transfer protein [Marinobacter sp. T13-3]